MPTIVKPTVVRAFREVIADKLTRRIGAILLLLAMIAFSIVTGIQTNNDNVWLGIFVGLGSLAALCILSLLEVIITPFAQYLWMWLRHGIDRDAAWEKNFPEHTYTSRGDSGSDVGYFAWLLICGFIAIPMFASAFVFSSNLNTVYIIGQKTTLNQFRVAVPFVQSIRVIDLSRTVTIEKDAKTIDGAMVRGTVTMKFSAMKDEATLIRLAGNSSDPNYAINKKAEWELDQQFSIEMSKMKLSELQSSLSIEYNTGKALDRKQLAVEGIYPDGKMEISNLHPYFSR